MKHFLQNLLVFFALCLCGLAAFQWHRETRLRYEWESARDTARRQTEQIQKLQSTLQLAEEEGKRLGGLRSNLAAAAESNRLAIHALTGQLERARSEAAAGAKQAEAFKSALQQANDNIQMQNDALKKLADERNDAVLKYNALVEKYNELVRRWNAQPVAGTNGPGTK